MTLTHWWGFGIIGALNFFIWADSSSGRAPRLQRGCGRFESCSVHKGVSPIKSRGSSVVEQRTENPCVASSILALGTTKRRTNVFE